MGEGGGFQADPKALGTFSAPKFLKFWVEKGGRALFILIMTQKSNKKSKKNSLLKSDSKVWKFIVGGGGQTRVENTQIKAAFIFF